MVTVALMTAACGSRRGARGILTNQPGWFNNGFFELGIPMLFSTNEFQQIGLLRNSYSDTRPEENKGEKRQSTSTRFGCEAAEI